MSYYDDNDVRTWGDIDPDDTDLESRVRLYIYDTVTKEISERMDTGEEVPASPGAWSDILGEELAWDNQQGRFLDVDDFDTFCELVDAWLPFFLKNYDPINDCIILD